jgi:hypothetical protein
MRFGEHGAEFLDEVLDVLELSIDTSETDVGNFVERSEMLHDQLSDVSAFDLGLKIGFEFTGDGGDDGFELLVADRSFPAGFFESAFDFCVVEGLAGVVFFDDFDGGGFDAFVGCVTAFAAETLASSSNGEAVLACSGVQHPIVIREAVGALHNCFRIASTPCTVQ